MRNLYLIVYFLNIFVVQTFHAQEIVSEQKIFASDREIRESFGQHVQIYDDFAFSSATTEGVKTKSAGTTSGAVYVFKKDSSGYWKEVQKLVGSGNDKVDNFGYSLERSENTIVIGAHSNTSNGIEYAGAAYVFDLNEAGNWVETQKLVASDEGNRSHFGIDVAISGNHIIVGAYGQKFDTKGRNPIVESGAAYIFMRNDAGVWSEEKKLTSPNREIKGRYGHTVYISDKYIAVGAVFEANAPCGLPTKERAGVLYMYELNANSEWNFAQRIIHSDREPHDSFGCEIIIQNEEMFVTSYYKEINGQKTAGAVYYFQRSDNGKWCEKQKIISPEPFDKDYFGHSVAMHKDLLVIGSGWWNKIGAGYLYKKSSCGFWTFIQKITATGPKAQLDDNDNFGGYVSISKDHVIIGADNDHHAPGGEDLYDAGSAFIFNIAGFDTVNVECDSNNVIESFICRPCEKYASSNESYGDENSIEGSGQDSDEGITTDFRITPNPNNGQFSIEVIGPMNGPYQVRIKKPFSLKLTKVTLYERTTAIDLGRGAKGAYFVQITTGDGVKFKPVYVE